MAGTYTATSRGGICQYFNHDTTPDSAAQNFVNAFVSCGYGVYPVRVREQGPNKRLSVNIDSQLGTKSEYKEPGTQHDKDQQSQLKVFFSTGRRKNARANVFMREGNGLFFVNGVIMSSYFKNLEERLQCTYPFELANVFGKYDTWALVSGFNLIASCQ